ncbi:MAG: beta-lactamase family protein [Clostridia bacterium]|nr:beta-lactamase family protein [Clostridia bacterium]
MNPTDLTNYLEKMPERGIPACDLVVTRDGEVVYRHAVGAEAGRDLYYVCSISKITTCTVAMRLVEEGKLGLDDPVAKYLPAYQNLLVKEKKTGEIHPAENVMTVRHLFTMTGGLNYNLRLDPILRARESDHPTTLNIVNSFVESPLDFEPGTKFQYSLCHDVLAAIVEVVSGKRFRDYVKEIILDPLGMGTTDYHLREGWNERIARQYRSLRGLARAEEKEPACGFILSDEYDSGGAGLITNGDEQIKLLTTLANGGKTPDGYQLLKPETIAMMEKGQLPDEVQRSFIPTRLFGYSWGLCGRVHVNPVVSMARSPLGEFGWDGATGPFALVDRKNRLALYFGTHIYDCDYLHHQVHPTLRDMAYEIFVK